MVRGRLRRMVVPVMGAMLLLTSCGDATKSHPQNSLRPKGPAARTIANLINPVFGIAAVVFVIILGGCLFVALKFRARDDDDFDDMPAQVHGNMKAEVGWTIGPAVILLFVGIATVATIFNLAKPPKKEAVRVILREVPTTHWAAGDETLAERAAKQQNS